MFEFWNLFEKREIIVKNWLTISEPIRLVFARLEGALGVIFNPHEIERMFCDSEDNQVDEKTYVFFDSPLVQVTGTVGQYEPESISISITAKASLVKRCQWIFDQELNRYSE